MEARKKQAVIKIQLLSTLDQVVNQALFNLKEHAFLLHLKYTKEGYHKTLLSSLIEGLPLLIGSKKVA